MGYMDDGRETWRTCGICDVEDKLRGLVNSEGWADHDRPILERDQRLEMHGKAIIWRAWDN